MTVTAVLALEDGTIFNGQSIGAKGNTTGEVVFNTALTGYQEILSDPSYSRQIVTLTYPHIGNTGTTPEDLESPTAYAAGLVVRDVPPLASNWRKNEDLREFLTRHKVVAISGIDTRKLTRILREKGAQAGCIMTGEKMDPAAAVRLAKKFPGLKGMDLAKVVTTKRSYQWNEGSLWQPENRPVMRAHQRLHVVAYDYGVKRNILRMLSDRGCRMTVVPAQTTAEEVLALEPDGVFLSNGPGDPEPCDYAIEAIRALVVAELPTFGICLGHQLLGLASGARTMKMKFGHHGANHPGAGPRNRPRVHHQPESRVRGRRERPAVHAQGHASLAVRRLAAGHRAHRQTGIQLPGPSGSEPGAAGDGRHVRPFRPPHAEASSTKAPGPHRGETVQAGRRRLKQPNYSCQNVPTSKAS